jgi:hypothetical protein
VGLTDVQKQNPGGIVVRNFDGNNAPRKGIVLRKPSWDGVVVLTRSNYHPKVKVYTEPSGGTEIAFPAGKKEFSTNDLPMHLYVQGDLASDNMRDVTLTLYNKDDPSENDWVAFTVLWVEISWKKGPAETVTDTNSKIEDYDAFNDDHSPYLERHNFTLPSELRRGWGYEITGTVQPPDFTEQVGWAQDWQMRGSLRIPFDPPRPELTTPTQDVDWTADYPVHSNDGPGDDWQDKVVDGQGRVFFLDFPGPTRTAQLRLTIKRCRANFKVAAIYNLDAAHTRQRCSEIRKHYVAMSIIQNIDPSGNDWGDVDNIPLDDGLAVEGQWGKLSWDRESPTITSIAPATGPNNGVVAVTLNGTSFVNGASVKLRMSGQQDIVATNVLVPDVETITCQFDLTARMPGPWDVVVENPADTTAGVKSNGFEITQP